MDAPRTDSYALASPPHAPTRPAKPSAGSHPSLLPGLEHHLKPTTLGAVESNAAQRRPVRRKRGNTGTRPGFGRKYKSNAEKDHARAQHYARGRAATQRKLDKANERHTRTTFEAPPIIPATAAELAFRHSGWRERRELVRQALIAAGEPNHAYESFCHCGAGAGVWRYTDAAGGRTLRAQYCHHRFCQPCGRARALLIADNLAGFIGHEDFVHVVFTRKHNEKPLGQQITELYKAFKKLRSDPIWLGRDGHKRRKMPRTCTTPARKRKWQAARHRLIFRWKTVSDAGAAFLQVHVAVDGLWHPHFHVLARAKWIAWRQLSRAWRKVTGDSNNVHVSRVVDRDAAVREVTRYASRPVDGDTIRNADKLAELICSLRGRRLSFTYGRFRGKRLTSPPPREKRPAVRECSLEELLARVARGNAEAIAILQQLQTRKHGPRAPPPPARHFEPPQSMV
jgi:hypothetical protein